MVGLVFPKTLGRKRSLGRGERGRIQGRELSGGGWEPHLCSPEQVIRGVAEPRAEREAEGLAVAETAVPHPDPMHQPLLGVKRPLPGPKTKIPGVGGTPVSLTFLDQQWPSMAQTSTRTQG